jgi:GNAT superfamily N-acetyltransferase
LLGYVEASELAGPLLRQHWHEVATNKDMMVLSPADSVYIAMEEAGVLFILGYFADGDLVGYSCNIVTPHLHYSGLTVCQNDVLYLDPDHRNGGAGIRLMNATEREGRARDARLMLWHAKDGSLMQIVLERRKYAVQDVVYSKAL